MAVDYNDQRFQAVEAEKVSELNNVNNTYNAMINGSDQYYQNKINATKDYTATQQKIQQDNTNFTLERIDQQKEQAGKDYTKEQSGSYVDFQKQTNQYGANAEQMASQGLNTSGYSESSKVSMYNQYQNRVSVARDVFSRAVLNYDNSIKEAQLANNARLAEIAYNALQTELELSLQGFQYKNTLLQTQLQQQQQVKNTSYAKWADVQSQINTENQLAESARQYNQNYQLQQQQLAEEKRQYEQKYNLEQQQLAIARAAAAKSASSSSSTINKTSNSKVKASTSTATVKLSNGKTGYTSATAAYKAIGGGRPLNDKGLLKDGYVMQSTYKGKTYYYAVKK